MQTMELTSLLPDILKIADAASTSVLALYHSDFKVEYKSDQSPVTAADRESHRLICEGLHRLTPDIPVLSEEGVSIAWDERKHWQHFWLIDPIDGTKEFLRRNGEFTVNIALIEAGEPVLGVVSAPALKTSYWGSKGEGAYKRDRTGKRQRIEVAASRNTVRIVASKNHLNDETRAFIEKFDQHTLVQAGSSLKFCLIAEGRADLYPRMGPTYEWDTAAAHAVLKAAGGRVETLDGHPLKYGKENLLNPFFVASS